MTRIERIERMGCSDASVASVRSVRSVLPSTEWPDLVGITAIGCQNHPCSAAVREQPDRAIRSSLPLSDQSYLALESVATLDWPHRPKVRERMIRIERIERIDCSDAIRYIRRIRSIRTPFD